MSACGILLNDLSEVPYNSRDVLLFQNVLQYHSALPHSPDIMSPASVSGRVPGCAPDPFDMLGGHSLEEYLDPTVDDLDIRAIEKEIGKVSGTGVDIPDGTERSSHASSLSSSLSSSYTGFFGSFGLPVGPVTPPFATCGPVTTFPSHVQVRNSMTCRRWLSVSNGNRDGLETTRWKGGWLQGTVWWVVVVVVVLTDLGVRECIVA